MSENSEKTMLIVDDIDYSRQLLRNAVLSITNNKSLKTKRFKFVNASNAQDAFAKIEQYKPDLIFLDIELPDLNGIEILKRIKQQTPQSFVVMVSAQSTIENVKSSLSHGASGFIVKPFSTVKVSDALHHFEKKHLK